ncbi:hypothetical protein FACS1894200_01350 [Spirochaetia bacterium]|nr:hypothetical protein FACS1894200_01350 [Spirochaetia bacterium]
MQLVILAGGKGTRLGLMFQALEGMCPWAYKSYSWSFLFLIQKRILMNMKKLFTEILIGRKTKQLQEKMQAVENENARLQNEIRNLYKANTGLIEFMTNGGGG